MLIGRIVGVHGLRGEVKVDRLTDFPQRFSLLRCVFLGQERRRYMIDSTREHRQHVLLRLEGVADRTLAESFRDAEIWIPRSEAMPLGEGQYYADDIIGLTVETTQGESLGEIRDILATGANDVYVVQGPHGEILIPAIRDVVQKIDIPQKRLVVEPMEVY